MSETKLDVRNLRISFRTQNGAVRAVRGIDFTVNAGETLCIVGESGSGKSVTVKAMLGILARNSIVESGEIIYEGQDLLKLTQSEFDELRGNRISMIYQDPLSSLDPIMRIGKQMTEAALVNGKVNRKRCKKQFKKKLGALSAAMKAAGISDEDTGRYVHEIEDLYPQAGKKIADYNQAKEYVESAIFSCDQLRVAVKKDESALIQEELGYLKERLEKAQNPYLIPDADGMRTLINGLPGTVDKIDAILKDAAAQETPDFLAELWAANKQPGEANGAASLYAAVKQALQHSNESYRSKQEEALKCVEKYRSLFEKYPLDINACKQAVKEMNQAVNASINPLNVSHFSSATTFSSTMSHSMDRYAKGVPGNAKENRRVSKETEKYEKRMKRKGDAPKVVPALLVDLDLTRQTMLRAIDDLHKDYREDEAKNEAWLNAETVRMLEYLQEKAVGMVRVVTKEYAYDSAIRIMEEVGISEPRKRFDQYPFEFSGGMRQRIVIAIAVAAHPDVLICDEPTTALDVTIQSQILELINDLKRKHNLTVIFITHDLGVVANMADKVAVMYAGQIVEFGLADDVYYSPAHPYTWALLSSMPDLETNERLEAIPGTPPNMIYPPEGDAFAPRNKYAMAIDFKEQPPRFQISDTHWAATWLLHPKAPKVEMPRIVSERIERMKKIEEEAQRNEKR